MGNMNTLEGINIINKLLDFKYIDPRGNISDYFYITKHVLKLRNIDFTREEFLLHIESYLIEKIKSNIDFIRNKK